jgi:quercetin dioxygenase-like cupin family protein
MTAAAFSFILLPGSSKIKNMKMEENMYTISRLNFNLKILAVIGAAVLFVLASSLYLSGSAQANTPSSPSGVHPELLGSGVLDKSIRGHFSLVPVSEGFNVKTDIGQLITVKITVDPGGEFGWHYHSGPVWVIVTSGTLTYYFSDPACSSVDYPAGSVFLDQGDYIHNARNETGEPVKVIGTFMLPDGGAPTIHVPDPGYCDFGG